MGVKDLFTNLMVTLLFGAYRLYGLIITPFLWLCLPLVKAFFKSFVAQFGIELNGKKFPTIRVVDDRAYIRSFIDWDLGIYESVMEGWIEYDGVATLERILPHSAKLQHPLYRIFTWFNLQTPTKAWEVGHEHYNLGNDLFEPMFGEHMLYSCGYWKNASTLLEAQEAKLKLIAEKLKLKAGMRVLEVGCGWGGLARFLAKNYGVSVVGYTISIEQKKYCEELCKGLPVEIRLMDYRTINEKFDRAVSIEMFEHVGARNYRDYFATVNRALKDDGIFLLQTMGISHHHSPHNMLWCHKYIFKNGYFPHHQEIMTAIDDLFIFEDWHNMGHYYYLTYKAWEENMDKAWPRLVGKYGIKFQRMWQCYLQTFQALWLTRTGQSWQIVFTKPETPKKPGSYQALRGGYQSIR